MVSSVKQLIMELQYRQKQSRQTSDYTGNRLDHDSASFLCARHAQLSPILLFYILFAFLLGPSPVLAQSLVLRDSDVLPLLTASVEDTAIRAMVNGPGVTYTKDLNQNDIIVYGGFGRFMGRLALLRMVETGIVGLDDPLFRLIPDIIEENPFDVAVTVRNLLDGTTGYSVPPHYEDGTIPSWAKSYDEAPHLYLIKQRRPGLMYHEDPAAAGLLGQLLTTISGNSLVETLNEWVIRPLEIQDLAKTSLISNEKENKERKPLSMLDNLQGPATLPAHILRHMMTYSRSGYLGSEAKALIFSPSWRLHPLGLTRTSGLTRRVISGHFAYHGEIKPGPGIRFILFPNQDLAFLSIEAEGDNEGFINAVISIAHQHIPPGKQSQALETEAKSLLPVSELDGIFIQENQPTAHIASRLDRIYKNTVSITDLGDGRLLWLEPDGNRKTFSPNTPMSYTGAHDQQLLFSSFSRAGFAQLGDASYRRIGALGDVKLVLAPMPWVVVLMLTIMIYAWRGPTRAWRMMGRLGAIGTVLILIALYFELNHWTYILYGQGMSWLVNLWRILLNIGLSLILTIPLYVMSFSRQAWPVTGIWLLIVPIHLTLLTAASLILFLLMVAWGLAGTFSAI